MKLVFFEDQRVAALMADALGIGFVPPFTTIGLERQGKLVGGCLFNNFNGYGIELTIVGPGCLSTGLFRAVSSYVFDQLGCARMTMTAQRKNAVHVRIAERLGFKVEGIMRGHFGDDDGIVLGMLRSECRFL